MSQVAAEPANQYERAGFLAGPGPAMLCRAVRLIAL